VKFRMQLYGINEGLGTVTVTYALNLVFGIILVVNYVYMFGALFWIAWHELDVVWYVVLVFACVKQCQSVQFSSKQAGLT